MDKSGIKKKKLYSNRHATLVQSQNLTDKDLKPLNAKVAEQRIQDAVILKAWRHQRERNKQLDLDVRGLMNQTEGLQLQVYALRQLLDAEKSRVLHVNNDLRRILTTMEECKREKQALIKENSQLETRMRIMEDRLTEMENNFKNQKNELLTAKAEAQSWEKQLGKEREKLSKLENERKLLEEEIPNLDISYLKSLERNNYKESKFTFEQVRYNGNLLVCQIQTFEQFSRLFNILQSKPHNLALPWDETLGRINPEPEISKKPEAKKNQKKQEAIVIVEKPQENPEVKALLAKVPRKIAEEDERTGELEKSILGKTEDLSLVLYKPIEDRIRCFLSSTTESYQPHNCYR